MWDPQAAVLADRHRVIRWDMRGHGDSDAPADPACYSHALGIGDMAAVLDACGARRAVLIGLSLGGFLSLLFHVRHRERVRALVLLDTGPGYRSEAARTAWNRYAEEQARGLEARGAAGLRHSSEVHVEWHRTLAGLPRAARGMLVQTDAVVIDSLASVAVPTLLVAGAGDTDFLAGMVYMAGKIRGARHEVIADAGHGVNLDQPARVSALLCDFLSGLPD
jgi:pimeloyl-ACP methyl ester carboxylesterase